MRRFIALLAPVIALTVLAAPAASAPPPQPITGRWLIQEGKAIVDVAPCGTAICGKIVKILVRPDGGTGAPRDIYNPDPAKRGRPLEGMTFMSGFRPDGQGGWEGDLYDAETGRSYFATMRRIPTGIEVEACMGIFCGQKYWTPAPAAKRK